MKEQHLGDVREAINRITKSFLCAVGEEKNR